VSFEKNWDDYEKGFGNVISNPKSDFNVTGEYWLGLKNIHTLCPTTSSCHLRVDLRDPDWETGELIFSEYSSFGIKGSSDNYQLNLSGYDASSTAGNAMLYEYNPAFNMTMNNKPFSINCTVSTGGWWWNNKTIMCGYARLNSKYNCGVGCARDWRQGFAVWYKGRNYTEPHVYPNYIEMKVRLHV